MPAFLVFPQGVNIGIKPKSADLSAFLSQMLQRIGSAGGAASMKKDISKHFFISGGAGLAPPVDMEDPDAHKPGM